MLNSLPKLISDELFLHRAEILPGLPWETIARLCTYYIMIYKSNEHLPENICMMTSSNGNIFRVTGHLCGEFTGHRWIPHTKASDAVLWSFIWSASE